MHKVLITGITGFLGSHIAEQLCAQNFEIIGLKRASSDIWRCDAFKEQVNWIDLDDQGLWKQKIMDSNPNVIIHSAWIGVESKDRDDWELQAKNIELLTSLLQVTHYLKLDKFIFLGSQSEYGNLNGMINEEKPVKPINAYAAIKLCCLQILETYGVIHQINWIWLRVFSVFGERESDKWLIPSLIKAIGEQQSMDFTKGEQQYAYLYVEDFAKILFTIIQSKIVSGVYNVSSNEPKELKLVITALRDAINPSFLLNFGVIPYRQNQSMHIEGDMAKLVAQIGPIVYTDFNVALNRTINYYHHK